MEIIGNKYSYKYRHKPQRPPRKKRSRQILLVGLLSLAVGIYSYLALARPVPGLAISQSREFAYQAEDFEMNWPGTGMAAVGSLRDGIYDRSTSNEQASAIASMTKVITALAVLDKHPLTPGETGELYTITEADAAIYHQYVARLGSVMPVRVGQQLSQYQLLQGLMLPSANNVADYLAVWLFGSMDNYLDYANSFLGEQGLISTRVSDASGFSPLSVSTPSDLIKIGQLALSDPVLREIVSQKTVYIPETGQIRNTNQLMTDEGVIGIKTGNTDEAGKCLLFAVEHGPDKSEVLIIVLMGQPGWVELYSSARAMRDQALNNFDDIELMPAQAVVANAEAAWGEASNLIAEQPLSIYGWKSRDYTVQLELDEVPALARSGLVIGSAKVLDTDKTVDISLQDSVGQPGIPWRLATYWRPAS